MFLGLVSPTGAGKHTVARILADDLNFTILSLTTATEPPSGGLSFDSPRAMLDYVTPRWRERFVTTDIPDLASLQIFRKRPAFVLLHVDAPVLVRFKRISDNYTSLGQTPPSIEQFLASHDHQIYTSSAPLAHIFVHADMILHNPYTDLVGLRQAITRLDLLNPDRLRPSWDTYFMHLADLAARRANCMKRRVGCILVRDTQVLASGYNGTPRGLKNCNEGGCNRCNAGVGHGEELHLCLCLHAEENALLEAGRERIRSAAHCTLYCNTCPCIGCAKKIIQAGVNEVVYSRAYAMDGESERIFTEAGVVLRQHMPLRLRLDVLGPLTGGTVEGARQEMVLGVGDVHGSV